MARITEITNSPIAPANQPLGSVRSLANPSADTFEEFEKAYFARYKPADLVESRIVSHLAFIDWRLKRIMAFEIYPRGVARPAADAWKLTLDRKQQNRIEATLVRSRLALLNTLLRLRRHAPVKVRTQIFNAGNEMHPKHEPGLNPAGLRANPNPGSHEPRIRPRKVSRP